MDIPADTREFVEMAEEASRRNAHWDMLKDRISLEESVKYKKARKGLQSHLQNWCLSLKYIRRPYLHFYMIKE